MTKGELAVIKVVDGVTVWYFPGRGYVCARCVEKLRASRN